jgi:hypothetical protein
MKSSIFLILLAGLQGAVCAAAGGAGYVSSSSGTSPDGDARELSDVKKDSEEIDESDWTALTPESLAAHDAAYGGAAGAASGGGGQDADAHSMHAGLHELNDKHLKAVRYLRDAPKMPRSALSTEDVELFIKARKWYAHAGSSFAKIARDEESKVEKVNSYFKAGKAYLFAADYKRAHECFSSVRKHFKHVNLDEVGVLKFELYGYTAITDILIDNKKHFEQYIKQMLLLDNRISVRNWMHTQFTEVLQSLVPADRVVFVELYQKFMKKV